MSEPYEDLRRELRAELPATLAQGLTPEEADRLTEVLHAARRRQRDALEQALDGALGFIPGLLRGPVKRVLGL